MSEPVVRVETSNLTFLQEIKYKTHENGVYTTQVFWQAICLSCFFSGRVWFGKDSAQVDLDAHKKEEWH